MKPSIRIAAVLCVLAGPVSAQEPTITLTRAELEAIVNSSVAQAMAQGEAQKAAGALAKVKAAFAPAQPEQPPAPASQPKK